MKSLNVDGYIVPDDDQWIYDWFGVAAVSPGRIRAFLSESSGEDIEIRMGTCYGGDVWAASDIYEQLRSYKGGSTAIIAGLSASAGTYMMLGCKTVVASPTAQMMIHCASSYAEGNEKDMTQAAQRLHATDESIINAYELKTKKSRSELKSMMQDETWFSATEMLDAGFIDRIDLKDGESLNEGQITAKITQRAYAAVGINPAKMHEMAVQMKQKVPESPLEEPKPSADNWQERASALLAIENARF